MDRFWRAARWRSGRRSAAVEAGGEEAGNAEANDGRAGGHGGDDRDNEDVGHVVGAEGATRLSNRITPPQATPMASTVATAI